jgi:hypothetical protein
MTLKGMGSKDLTPYEQVKLGYMANKNHTSGIGIAGLTVGVGAAVLAIAAGAWAGSRAQNAKEVAVAKNDGLKDLVQTLAGTLVAERTERIEGDRTLSISINDQVSGSQSGQLTASQIAQLEQSQQLQLGLMTGKYSENPQKVMLYSAPQPCGCPGSCNG